MSQLSLSSEKEFWSSFLGSKNLEADRPPEEDFDSISYSLQHLLPVGTNPDVEAIRLEEVAIAQQLVNEELQNFELSLTGDKLPSEATKVAGPQDSDPGPIPATPDSHPLISIDSSRSSRSISPLPQSPSESSASAPDSNGYSSHPESPSSSTGDESAMKELLQRISWKPPVVEIKKRRREPRNGPVTDDKERERHKQTEKKRREEINDAVRHLRSLLPTELQERRTSQVEILNDAVSYFAKVQQLAMSLMQENKRLAARTPEPIPAPDALQPQPNTTLINTATPARAFSVRDGSRLFVITSFLLLANFGMPVLLSFGNPTSTTYTGRLLQSLETPAGGSWLCLARCFLVRLLWFYLGLFVVFLFSLVYEYFLVPASNTAAAVAEIRRGLAVGHKGQAASATRHLLNALALLGKPFPDTTFGLLLFVALHYLRVLMAVFCIGRRVEQLALRFGRRSAATLGLEAVAYQALLYQDTPLIHRPLTSAAFSLALLGATIPFKPDDPMRTRFYNSITYRVHSKWMSVLLYLAQAFLRPVEDSVDRANWLVGQQLVRSGRFEEARKRWEMSLAHSCLPDFGRRRLLILFGVTYLLEGDVDRALMMSGEAARLAATAEDQQALMWAVSVASHALFKLKGLEEAAARLIDGLRNAAKMATLDGMLVLQSVGLASPVAHLAFARGEYDEVMPLLRECVDAMLNRNPNVYEHMICVNSLGSLIHQVWMRALQPDAPAVLKKAVTELDELSERLLEKLTRSANPCNFPALIPCLHRLRALRFFLKGNKADALMSCSSALQSAKELNLPNEENQVIALQELIGGNAFNV